MNKFEEVIQCFEKVIEIDPVYVQAYYGIAEILKKKKDYNGAIDYYKNAIDLCSDY